MTPTPAATPEELDRVQDFLASVGIVMQRLDTQVHGFLPGVQLDGGVLKVGVGADLDSILHEAGHLAITPAPFRSWMSGNLARGQRQMCEALSSVDLDPECDLVKHSIQCSDPEATAWAFAVGRRLGFADDLTILDSSYQGEGASIRAGLAVGSYSGINGLVAAGMCAHGFGARMRGEQVYPVMHRWTQDGPYPEWQPSPAPKPRGLRLR